MSCVCMYVCVYVCICVYMTRQASCLWVEFVVGWSLDSVSQPGLAPGMEFPLRIKQDSTMKPGRPRGGDGGGWCSNSELPPAASVLDCLREGLCYLCSEFQALLGPWPRRMGKERGVALMGLGREAWSCCGQDWSHEAASREWRGSQRGGYRRLGPMGPTGDKEAGLCSTYLGKWMCVFLCVLACCGMQVGNIHIKGPKGTSSKPSLFLSCPETQAQNLVLEIKDLLGFFFFF